MAAPQSVYLLEEELILRLEEGQPQILPMDEEEGSTSPMKKKPSLLSSLPTQTSSSGSLPAAVVMSSSTRSRWGVVVGAADSAVRRHIHFGGIQSIQRIESLWDMTEEEVSDRWYSKAELGQFKQAARDLCKGEFLRLGRSSGTTCPIDEETSSTRGMDVYFPSRQRHQAKYVWHVLQAFHGPYRGNPDYVALLCEKWSTTVSIRAAERAMQDFYDAYFPSLRVLGSHQEEEVGDRRRSHDNKEQERPANNNNSNNKDLTTRPNNKRAAPPTATS